MSPGKLIVIALVASILGASALAGSIMGAPSAAEAGAFASGRLDHANGAKAPSA